MLFNKVGICLGHFLMIKYLPYLPEIRYTYTLVSQYYLILGKKNKP